MLREDRPNLDIGRPTELIDESQIKKSACKLGVDFVMQEYSLGRNRVVDVNICRKEELKDKIER